MAEATATTGTEEPKPISSATRSGLDSFARKPPIFREFGKVFGNVFGPVLDAKGIKGIGPFEKTDKTKEFEAPKSEAQNLLEQQTVKQRRRAAILSGDLADEDTTANYVPRIGGQA